MKTFAIRLTEGQDLKKEILIFTRKNNILAGCILTCVGSLKKIHVRMADEKISKIFEKNYEINSLVGTFSQDGIHLHISISDEEGKLLGGHLLEGNIFYTTAEIVIGSLEDMIFSRKFDEKTGFKELIIDKK
ncbi:DNA-binding protein [Candidatus Gracilibacteria bacterium]|nr:DNA-binding protein [Candidatus Gracilibacteria bacterium]NUJ99481.1 DNA-binding protein [Candidatus Gracilibacteria bacterium]